MKTIVCFLFVLGALSAEGEVFLAKVGRKATLECGVDTYKAYLIWYKKTDDNKEDKIVSLDKSGRTTRGSAAIKDRSRVTHNTRLEISQVKEADAGRFLCDADGTKREHTLVVVSVSIDPSGDLQVGSRAKLHCQVNPQDVQKVQWKSPGGSHSGPEKNLDPVATSDKGTWQCTFTYGGRTFSENLTINVREPPKLLTTPSNPKNSVTTGTTGRDSRNDFQLLGLPWWVWLSIGVGCLVVILLIVLVIILCKKIRRRKRKLQMMKNAQHLMRSNDYCKCDRPAAAPKPQQGRRREKPSALLLKPH